MNATYIRIDLAHTRGCLPRKWDFGENRFMRWQRMELGEGMFCFSRVTGSKEVTGYMPRTNTRSSADFTRGTCTTLLDGE